MKNLSVRVYQVAVQSGGRWYKGGWCYAIYDLGHGRHPAPSAPVAEGHGYKTARAALIAGKAKAAELRS